MSRNLPALIRARLKHSLLALLGSLTPSMANNSPPIRPCASQVTSTWANSALICSPNWLTNLAMCAWLGWLFPPRAMNCTLCRQARSMARLDSSPWLWANSTILSITRES